MNKRKSLGRSLGDLGLSELLSDIKKIDTTLTTSETILRKLPIDLLIPGKYQPRRNFDPVILKDLANSIRAQGIIQPLVVRPLNNGNYEIIAGERRWRAAQLAELTEVPAIIREIPDEQAIALSLIENIQREDLNSIDTALGMKRLIDEFDMTHEGIAEVLGKSRTAVTNLLRLLALNTDVQLMLKEGKLDMGHARALLGVDLLEQPRIAQMIIAQDLSVRATEMLIRHLQKSKIKNTTAPDQNIISLQNQLSDAFGTKVNIFHSKSGKGKLVFHYHNVDELDGILQRLNISNDEELLD